MIKMELSHGNSKLGKDTLIMNMGSATCCPSAKRGLCKLGKRCYALKAERQYPPVLPYRNRQARAWNMLTAEDIAATIIRIAARKQTKIKYLRFSEAGDFSTQADVDKMSTIAALLGKFGIKVYGYTARNDLDYSDVNKNMVVTGSGFMVHNSFTAVENIKSWERHCDGDCHICMFCKSRGGRVIKVLYH